VGIPLVLYDSAPDEPFSAYMKAGFCFECQRIKNDHRSPRKRPSLGKRSRPNISETRGIATIETETAAATPTLSGSSHRRTTLSNDARPRRSPRVVDNVARPSLRLDSAPHAVDNNNDYESPLRDHRAVVSKRKPKLTSTGIWERATKAEYRKSLMNEDGRDSLEGSEQGDDMEGGKCSAKETDPEFAPSVVSNGMIEFSLAPIQAQLTCGFCQGLFKEPYTATNCFHTFCKSCLLFSFSQKHFACPTCGTYLGKNLEKFSLPDHRMQDLIDKVLFPDLVLLEQEEEAAFYRARGMARKLSVRRMEKYEDNSSSKRSRSVVDSEQQVKFILLPDEHAEETLAMPRLASHIIETQGVIRIGQLKRYLSIKMPSLALTDPMTQIDIVCNGLPLGNELSATFILRTVWMDTAHDLLLTYRKAKTSVSGS
jgi:hypothetical protein